MHARAWLLTCVFSLACPVVAAAQEGGGETGGEDAKLLFDEGLKYMLEGDLKMGCAFIKQSLDVDPRPGTLFTLAECYGRAGKYASAVEHYDEYLNVYSKLSPDEKERQRARAEVSRKERARMVKLVPWITVVLPEGAPDGVVVTMDDDPLPRSLFGVAIAVDPGTHRFTTRAPGGPLTETKVEVEPGKRITHTLKLYGLEGSGSTTVTEGPADPDDVGADEGASHTPWVIAFGSLGAAGIITGTVTGIMLLDKRSTILDRCDTELPDGSISCGPEGSAEAQEALDAADTAQNTLAPLTTIALGVGVGSLAVAGILWLTDSSPEEEDDTADNGIAARASLGPGAATFILSGHF